MSQIHSVRRCFVVYGRSDQVRWGPSKTYVVEDTEWAPDEHHRDGLAHIMNIGRWFVGVGLFDKPLSAELLAMVEEQAVWLEDVEPGEIGSWRGGKEAGATTLGRSYEVPRREDGGAPADEAGGAPPEDDHDPADALD